MFLAVFLLSLALSDVASDNRWSYTESTFPSVWFGANATGPDAPFLSRMRVTSYNSVYFGWQVMNDISGCKHEEADLSQSAAAVKKLKPSVTTTVYAASGSNLYGFYDWQAAAMADPSLQGFFLTSIKAGRLGGCQFSSKEWDWRNASARDYFVDKIVGPWVKNDAVDAIFIDEGDAVMCRNQTGLPTEEMFKWANGSFEVYRRSAASLAAVNKRLVLSLKNGYVGAEPEEPKVPLCPVPYDAVVEYMQPVPWIRYHEYFGTLEESQKSTMCHNLMATAVRNPSQRTSPSPHTAAITPHRQRWSSRLPCSWWHETRLPGARWITTGGPPPLTGIPVTGNTMRLPLFSTGTTERHWGHPCGTARCGHAGTSVPPSRSIANTLPLPSHFSRSE